MSEKSKNQDITEFKKNYKQIQKLVSLFIVVGIIFVSIFIVYYYLNQEPPSVGFGILNEDKKAEDYPTEVAVNEEIDFYVTVDNHLDRKFKFQLEISKGDEDTELSSKGAKHAELNFTTDKETLEVDEEWMSDKLTISFTEVGDDQLIIVELYEITEDNDEEFYDIVYLRIDVTDDQ
ncbi:MAG: DUF1616 domain-containing protein [Promethearchaeota archaeon]